MKIEVKTKGLLGALKNATKSAGRAILSTALEYPKTTCAVMVGWTGLVCGIMYMKGAVA